ncbi:MAG TPA: polyhydroxyalkanoate synthesis regulator DNA-binding domain-containing protein, partial [Terriglobales bacterium]|nr:polyhydroxyalkanoate synthesis regulator DNA-binding domain-containing protein [Terriglobales bacterium]
RYVTLDNVTDLVRAGEDLEIVDNDSGEDLTALTFAQIILEEEKRKRGMLDLPVLRWIIQQGGATLQELLHQVDRGREALENMREMAEQRVLGVRGLVRREPPTKKAASGKKAEDSSWGFNELLEMPQRQIEQLQRRIDAQVRSSVDAISKHPALRQELRRLEEGIQRIEQRLAGTPRPTGKGRSAPKPRKTKP